LIVPLSAMVPVTVPLPDNVAPALTVSSPPKINCAPARVQGVTPLKSASRAVAVPVSVVMMAPLLKFSVSIAVGRRPPQFAATPRLVLPPKRLGFQVRTVM
jgi:hypothetical protein